MHGECATKRLIDRDRALSSGETGRILGPPLTIEPSLVEGATAGMQQDAFGTLAGTATFSLSLSVSPSRTKTHW